MKFIYLTIGFFAFVLGCAGIVLPVLPTTPFLLLAAVCFTRGSRWVDQWFRQTKVYDGKCIWADLHFVSDTIEILLFYMQDQDGKEKRKERDNIP